MKRRKIKSKVLSSKMTRAGWKYKCLWHLVRIANVIWKKRSHPRSQRAQLSGESVIVEHGFQFCHTKLGIIIRELKVPFGPSIPHALGRNSTYQHAFGKAPAISVSGGGRTPKLSRKDRPLASTLGGKHCFRAIKRRYSLRCSLRGSAVHKPD